MHTQKTHLLTIPPAAPFIMAEEEGVSNRVQTPVSREGAARVEMTWKLPVAGSRTGFEHPLLHSSLPTAFY